MGYNRELLDVLLARGAAAKVGTTVEDAEVRELEMRMTDTAIQVEGHLVVPVFSILPDVDVRLDGPMAPSLVRGTTALAFDLDGVDVDVDDSDEAFSSAMKWLLAPLGVSGHRVKRTVPISVVATQPDVVVHPTP